MFVDASALTAIALSESDRDTLLARLEEADKKNTSAVSVLEAIMAIGRETGDRSVGLPAVRKLLDEAEIAVSDIGADLIDTMAEAHMRYGKGSGHPARLNLGDCISYAMAKSRNVPLLYKGNDFAHTDMA